MSVPRPGVAAQLRLPGPGPAAQPMEFDGRVIIVLPVKCRIGDNGVMESVYLGLPDVRAGWLAQDDDDESSDDDEMNDNDDDESETDDDEMNGNDDDESETDDDLDVDLGYDDDDDDDEEEVVILLEVITIE